MSIIRFEGFEGYSSLSAVNQYIDIDLFQSAAIESAINTNWSNISDIDAFYPNIVLLLEMEGLNNGTVFLDSSPKRKTATRVGNPTTNTSFKKNGSSSAYFNGSSYLSLGTDSDLDLSTDGGSFTIEGWIYITNPNNYNGIIGSRQNGTLGGWCFYIHPNNTLYTGSKIVGQGYQDRQLNTTTIPANTWTHFAIVKTATSYTAYINGVAGTPLSLSNGLEYPSNRPLVIGALGSEGELPFSGYIDDLKITKNVARYTSNFTPPANASKGFSPAALARSSNFLGLNASYSNNISYFPKIKIFDKTNTYNECTIGFKYYLNTISQPISSFDPIAIVVDINNKPHFYICINSSRQLEIRRWNTAASFGASSTNYTAASYMWNVTPITYSTSGEYCGETEADHFIHTIGNPGCGNVQRHTYTLDGTNKMVLLGTSTSTLLNNAWNNIEVSFKIDNAVSSNNGYIKAKINKSLYNTNLDINLTNIRTSTQSLNTMHGVVLGLVWNGTSKNAGVGKNSYYDDFYWLNSESSSADPKDFLGPVLCSKEILNASINNTMTSGDLSSVNEVFSGSGIYSLPVGTLGQLTSTFTGQAIEAKANNQDKDYPLYATEAYAFSYKNNQGSSDISTKNSSGIISTKNNTVSNNKIIRFTSSFASDISVFPKFKYYNSTNTYNEIKIKFDYYLDSITQPISSFIPIVTIVDGTDKPHLYLCINSNGFIEIRRWNTSAAFGASSTNYTSASYVWNAIPATYSTTADYCNTTEADHFIHTVGNPGCGNIQRHTYTLDGTNKMVLIGTSSTSFLNRRWNSIDLSVKLDNAASANTGNITLLVNGASSLTQNNIRTSTQNNNTAGGIVVGMVWNGTTKNTGSSLWTSSFRNFEWYSISGGISTLITPTATPSITTLQPTDALMSNNQKNNNIAVVSNNKLSDLNFIYGIS
jgi:hypothetical protein